MNETISDKINHLKENIILKRNEMKKKQIINKGKKILLGARMRMIDVAEWRMYTQNV